MGVSLNGGTPKWMVYNGKPYLNGWFGGTPIFGNTQMLQAFFRAETKARNTHFFPKSSMDATPYKVSPYQL